MMGEVLEHFNRSYGFHTPTSSTHSALLSLIRFYPYHVRRSFEFFLYVLYFFALFIRIDVMKLEGRQLENDTNMQVQNMKRNMRGYAHIERIPRMSIIILIHYCMDFPKSSLFFLFYWIAL